MAQKIILIQHTNGTTPGHVTPWLQARGVPYQHIKLQHGEPLPTVDETASLILCGGGVHVDQEDKFPWLRPEKKYIESCLAAGTKVLGLCLGGQLCAQILGAKVYPHPNGWEVGWHDVNLKKVPGLPGFDQDQILTVSQYHRYVFELPPGATNISSNAWWEVQAFEWKKQVIGFQFHPERDQAGNDLIAQEPDLPTQGLVHNASEILALGEKHEPISRQWFWNLLDGFVLGK